jgi:hypothetical protein
MEDNRTEPTQNLIETDVTYIPSSRYHNDIEEFINEHPNGAPIKLVAKILGLAEDLVDKIYKSAIIKLRNRF